MNVFQNRCPNIEQAQHSPYAGSDVHSLKHEKKSTSKGGYSRDDAPADTDNSCRVRTHGASGDPVSVRALQHEHKRLAFRTVGSLLRVAQRVDDGCQEAVRRKVPNSVRIRECG